MKHILITLDGNNIAFRFDFCTEIWMGQINENQKGNKSKNQKNEKKNQYQAKITGEILILPKSSPEYICQLIIDKKIDILICGGIEDEYYDYLKWKKVTIYDSVIGSYNEALQNLIRGRLKSNKIFDSNIYKGT